MQDHRAADIVAVYLCVGVGVRYEKPDQLGYAHFQEHMLFKGTDTFGPGYIDRTVEGVGGRTNAFTSFDYTTSTSSCPSEATEIGRAELLADMAFRSTFDPKEIDRERAGHLRGGATSRRTIPKTAIIRQIYGLVFADHPYGRPSLGTPRDDETRRRARSSRRFNQPVLHAGEHDAGGGRPGRPGDGARHGRPRRSAASRPRATRPPPRAGARRRSRGVVAQDGGAARAAGVPGAGLAGARARRPERRRRRPAHHDPRGHRELAPRRGGCATRSAWSPASP